MTMQLKATAVRPTPAWQCTTILCVVSRLRASLTNRSIASSDGAWKSRKGNWENGIPFAD